MKRKNNFPSCVALDYDAIMSSFDYSLSANICDKIIQLRGIPVKSDLLEVGIGTGRFASQMQEKRYVVSGIDNSEAMLGICKKEHPEIPIDLTDISEFQAKQLFPVIISHAGPIRLNHLCGLDLTEHDEMKFRERYGELFFESYLKSEEEVESALGNISDSLKPGGLFLMYIQDFPGRSQVTRSTPIRTEFNGNKQYEVRSKFLEDRLVKERTVFEEGIQTWSIRHTLYPMHMEDFKDVARRCKLKEVCIDPSNNFYVMEKA